MLSSKQIIALIKGFPISERLQIVEAILKDIRQESVASEQTKASKENSGPSILQFAGILDEEEARDFKEAVKDCRKIDIEEW